MKQLGEPPAMRCRWAGCQEEVGETQEGLTDTAGALVELSVDGVLEWLQPIDFYIHVSGHAYTETGDSFDYLKVILQSTHTSFEIVINLFFYPKEED